MISSDIMRGYNDIFILAILKEEDSYGYDISRKITQLADNLYKIKETTLYSAFTRLKKNDYIIDYPGEKTHGRPRTYYSITDKGKQYLKDKQDEWQITKHVVENIIGVTNHENI